MDLRGVVVSIGGGMAPGGSSVAKSTFASSA
jgi:hypothetical protein